jgi:hypothetical protein
MDPARCFRAFVIVGTVAALIMWAALVKALGHDWYPTECCSAMDCAPVDKVESIAGATYSGALGIGHAALPITIVTTKLGTAIVPPDFPRRESKDNRMHACMTKAYDGSGNMQLLCIFIPPAM